MNGFVFVSVFDLCILEYLRSREAVFMYFGVSEVRFFFNVRFMYF